MVMVFNATFNNISVISWWSVLLVGETGIPGENHQAAARIETSRNNCFEGKFEGTKKVIGRQKQKMDRQYNTDKSLK